MTCRGNTAYLQIGRRSSVLPQPSKNMEDEIDFEEIRYKAGNNMQPTAWVICASGKEYTADLIKDNLGKLEDFAAICQQELCNVKNLSVKEGRPLYPAEKQKIRRLAYVQATVEREVIDRRKRIGRRRSRFLADFFEKAGKVLSDEQYTEVLSKIDPQYLQDMKKDESEWEDIMSQKSLSVDPPSGAFDSNGKTFNVSKVPVDMDSRPTTKQVEVIRRRKVALCQSRRASSPRTTFAGP